MGGKKVRLGLVQMRMDDSIDANLEKAVRMVGEAAKKGAQMVCLPELFTSPYFAQKSKGKIQATKYVETIPGTTSRALAKAAKENSVVLIGGSIYEKDGSRLYNTSLVFDQSGNLLGKYRKIHVPQDECFFEKDYFNEGNLGFRVFATKYGKIAPLICYDQWFPEAARSVALMGAEMVFYPTAIGTVEGVEQAEGSWQEAWENVMRGHAIANGVVVAAVNRCGKEGRMNFWGGSFVCDAFGKTLERAGSKEEVLIAEINSEHGKEIREGWGFLRNRRPKEYSRIAKE